MIRLAIKGPFGYSLGFVGGGGVTNEEQSGQNRILGHQLQRGWQKPRWETMVLPGKHHGKGTERKQNSKCTKRHNQ